MGTTPVFAIPYVEPTDFIAQYPAAMKAQSEQIEAALSASTVWGWAKQTANQAIPHGAVTPLASLTLESASEGVTLVGSSLKVPTAGVYLITGILTFTHNTTGGRSAFMRRNTVSYLRSVAGLGTSTGSITGSIIFRLAANDLIDWCGYQSSGAALNTDAGSNGCSFQVVRLSL